MLFIKNEVLSKHMNEDTSFLDKVKIQKSDLAKLCQKHEALDP